VSTDQPREFEPLREGYEVAVGSRRDFAVTVRNLVESNRDAVLTQLATDEVARDYADAIRIGIKKRDRTALNLYAQIMKLVGEERRIVVEFVQGLGVRNEGDLKRMVEMARSVEGVGPHDGAERCVAYLEAYFNAFPDQRPAALRRLGGYVPVAG
jgi:hypothetical protein